MNKTTIALLVPAVCLLTCQLGFAGSATWNSNATSKYWDDDDNWMPASHPNGPTDVATFDVSNETYVNLETFPHDLEVESVVFNSGASAYQITTNSSYWEQLDFTISGAGVINNSGILQRFSISYVRYNGDGYPCTISFKNNATAGNLTGFIVGGSEGDETFAGVLNFNDTSNAGSSVIDNFGSRGWLLNGQTFFRNSSSAANAVITNKATSDGAGEVWFYDTASAGDSTIINNGNPAADEDGGETIFSGFSDAGSSTIICNQGGTGGLLQFWSSSTGGTARIELHGNGSLHIDRRDSPGVTIGSVEGNGEVILGENNLTIGSNNLSTTFSGTIQDTGSITKIGTGNLTFTGSNSYEGGTTVNGGILLANNKRGSGTGSGPVQVLAGTFGGSGRVSGAVTIGSGNGSGAALAPGARGVTPGTLTIRSTLTLKSDATYKVTLNSDVATADAVKAKGVVIQGTLILFNDLGSAKLATGTVFTVINNTAATQIAGTFANLSDGSTVVVGNNTFQANYEGGDGNDLTLTVVP